VVFDPAARPMNWKLWCFKALIVGVSEKLQQELTGTDRKWLKLGSNSLQSRQVACAVY
jgi:hypothetical protein